jgi:hypothetical protein
MTLSKHRGMRTLAASVCAVLGTLVFAVSAMGANHPKGEYAPFAECPLARPTITDCVLSVSNGGFFQIGKKNVPLVNPVTLQGGFEGAGTGIKFYGAESGNTLSKTPQPVPGGLLGITAPTWWPKSIQTWFNNLINEGFTGVNATVEIAGPTKGLTGIKLNTENLIEAKGTALGLPAKIHLENGILGSSCYIGSDASPVQINFTSGTDGKLTGNPGKFSANEEFTILTFAGGKLVNNSFAAPTVNGCGGIFSFLINPLVNEIIGLPAAAGTNSAALEGSIKDANAEATRASE